VADFQNGSGPFITSEAQIKNNRPGFPGRLGGFGKSVLVSAGTMPLPLRVAATPRRRKWARRPRRAINQTHPWVGRRGLATGRRRHPLRRGVAATPPPHYRVEVSAGRTKLTRKRFSPPAW
jgi:hypothetical protein